MRALAIIESGVQLSLRLGDEELSLAEERLTGVGGDHDFCAAVARVLLPGDQSAVFEVVDERDDLARIESEELRQLALRWARPLGDGGQDRVRRL